MTKGQATAALVVGDEPSQALPAASALPQLLELSGRATPGPWTGVIARSGRVFVCVGDGAYWKSGGDNTALIVAAVNYVRSLELSAEGHALLSSLKGVVK